jgi:cytochrome c oxidase assembly factor CtaG
MRRMIAPTLIAALTFAHGDDDAGWTLDAWVIVPLLIALLAFVVGYARVRRRATEAPLSTRQIALFLAGWCVLAGALVSPLHAAGERSFALHMLEHELLMLVAAPLLVAARVQGAMLWSLPHGARVGLARFFQTRPLARTWHGLTDPFIATALQAAALWLWHAPPLFDLALRSDGWHIAQHLSFLFTALVFWSAMFNLRHNRTRPMAIVVCLFATALISGALGALMAFSSSPWYAGYRALGLDAFGLMPTQDQQIAGLLMWIPGGMVHLGVAIALFGHALRQTERGDAH